MFKKLKKKISALADTINGVNQSDTTVENPSVSLPNPDGDKTIPMNQLVEKEVNEPKEAKTPVAKQPSVLDNAIDNRDRAVTLIVDAMREATGTNTGALANMTVWVATDGPDYNPLDYSWADAKMVDDLRLALDNAMLEAVGKESINIEFDDAAVLASKPGMVEVVPNVLYVAFRAGAGSRAAEDVPVKAWISIVEGTGSMLRSVYELDSTKKRCFNVGRGAISRKANMYRRNDIVVKENDSDEEMQKMNNHVSGAQMEIVARNGAFYVKASAGGCRSLGGASTKLIHQQNVVDLTDTHTLHPLADGDMIEMGKTVVLLFTLTNPE